MDTKHVYKQWAGQYDSNVNKTRDTEAVALRKCLSKISFNSVLELGCGTGKNTQWLMKKANNVTAVDFSDEMLAVAREKITSSKVQFKKADITQPWKFIEEKYDLVTFSLVLEHIKNLEPIFSKAYNTLKKGGYVYIGELHPYKQYTGTKARVMVNGAEQIAECFNHHISEFVSAAKKAGFIISDINEFYDNDKITPRILSLTLKK